MEAPNTVSPQERLHRALEVLREFDPEAEALIRMDMPAYAVEDLTNDQARDILGWLHEDGLL